MDDDDQFERDQNNGRPMLMAGKMAISKVTVSDLVLKLILNQATKTKAADKEELANKQLDILDTYWSREPF